jgi:predicted transcriptional regulator
MIDEELRQAIRESELSKYRICKEAEIDESSLYRFLSGERDLRMKTASRICEVLGLHLVRTDNPKGGE